MSMVYDEYGRPFVILREQQSKSRIKGIEATKSNILAARSISKMLRTSLGPKGLDKMLINQDGDVTITNDGATILQQMSIDHPISKLIVELSQSQDDEIGDGTTGVVVLAGALLEQAELLMKRGIHPIRIAEGYERAANIAIQALENVAAESIDIHSNNHEVLITTAMTTLSSKILQSHKRQMAEIAVNAILMIADIDRKDVNMERIRIEAKTGGCIQDTKLIRGIILNKEISHPQMKKCIHDAKICILTCPFEPPKPKTRHKLDITNRESYEALYHMEQQYFKDMISMVKESGANLVICQWGFDDEANHLLLQNQLPAVRWVGGIEIEHLAMATGARIIPRFEDITSEKLGHAGRVTEMTLSETTYAQTTTTTSDDDGHGDDGDKKSTTNNTGARGGGSVNDQRVLLVEDPVHTSIVTVLLRGGNNMIVQEAQRSLHDAMCVVRNLIKDDRVVYGGGAAEMTCAHAVHQYANSDQISNIDQYPIRAFGDALHDIPMALAENAGYSPFDVLAALQTKHAAAHAALDAAASASADDTTKTTTKKKNNNNHVIGIGVPSSTTTIVDGTEENDDEKKEYNNTDEEDDENIHHLMDMRKLGVFETLIGKQQQIQLAAQVVKMILKIDDVISMGQYE